MDAYLPIRKVPLLGSGISSSAFGVQMEKRYANNRRYWDEVGVVGSNYLLVPNKDVSDLADTLCRKSDYNWTKHKTFFNGRNYMTSYITEDCKAEISQGDDIALGMSFWNSYDGSTALHFRLFVVRLICDNGMISKDNFLAYRFRHDKSSEGFEEDISRAVNTINTKSKDSLDKFIANARTLMNPIDMENVAHIRHEYLKDIPTGVFGKIMDKYLEELDANTGWEFLNACTNVLWHNKKQTIADFKHNTLCVDGMLEYAGEHLA